MANLKHYLDPENWEPLKQALRRAYIMVEEPNWKQIFYWNREDARRILSEAIAKQTSIDNIGDGKSIVLDGSYPSLDLEKLLDDLFAGFNMEIGE
jgi:hypothetical protein